MGFLQDRRILVTGMLSNRSIAYGIAKACHREGAKLAPPTLSKYRTFTRLSLLKTS